LWVRPMAFTRVHQQIPGNIGKALDHLVFFDIVLDF
jgi:hypothetical protein